MSRKLKFRFWSDFRKAYLDQPDHWSNDSYTFGEIDHELYVCHRSCGEFEDVEEGTVEQFTGVKDKNGIEIYEGDLWKSPYGKVEEIKWICETDGYDWTGWSVGYTESMGNGEVIGNIHEGERNEI